jgi:hypothetical protein
MSMPIYKGPRSFKTLSFKIYDWLRTNGLIQVAQTLTCDIPEGKVGGPWAVISFGDGFPIAQVSPIDGCVYFIRELGEKPTYITHAKISGRYYRVEDSDVEESRPGTWVEMYDYVDINYGTKIARMCRSHITYSDKHERRYSCYLHLIILLERGWAPKEYLEGVFVDRKPTWAERLTSNMLITQVGSTSMYWHKRHLVQMH